METSPGNACQGFVHIWNAALKIKDPSNEKNCPGLICQEY